jgi:phospholipid/cholesterol/gamma-HCH transport system ATP-binding protein
MEIEIALRKHALPFEFSRDAERLAAKLPDKVRKADLAERRDLRDLALVTIDGETAKDFDDGYVFQYAALFDSLNVHENVVMGLPETELARMSRRDVARRVWDAIEIVNLEPREVLAKIPSELSGGMKKRVGIARAIVGRPEILLWDEPTTGLDPINTAAIERLIQRLSKELEVTSLLVTHDIEGGLEMCDRVGMLEGGLLRFCGTPEEFRNCPDQVVRAFIDRAAAEAALDMMSGTR